MQILVSVATPLILQTYDNAIIYSGDKDKAVAIIMTEFLPNSTIVDIVDIADYKSYMCRNVTL
ncbi:hypothetical protein [Metaclostridioides mangenotii]|uniref:hypothetical protein n=1 Tax=Metaclostridioides mangenotii TaxID=1540 RepID=UPI0028EA08E5|nr:hypothetical protein [Clostridioides mangenotii]